MCNVINTIISQYDAYNINKNTQIFNTYTGYYIESVYIIITIITYSVTQVKKIF